jgi:hypothetical protein
MERQKLIILFLILMSSISALSDQCLTPPAFNASAQAKNLTHANDYAYILVDGIRLFYFSRNFQPAIEVLRDELSVKDVVLVSPEVSTSINENALLIAKTISSVIQKTHKNIYLVAQSRGAAEALLSLLDRPQLLVSASHPGVAKIILAQGALKGTPLADIWDTVCNASPNFIAPVSEILCAYLSPMRLSLKGLTPAVMENLVGGRISQLTPEQVENFRSKIYFVRSALPAIEASFFIKPGIQAINEMTSGCHDNDGMIPASSQIIQGLGQDLGVFRGAHSDLFHGRPAGLLLEKKTFFKNLLEFTQRQ